MPSSKSASARDHAMCADVSNEGQFDVQPIVRETADGIIEKPTGPSGFDNKGIPASCVDEVAVSRLDRNSQ